MFTIRRNTVYLILNSFLIRTRIKRTKNIKIDVYNISDKVAPLPHNHSCLNISVAHFFFKFMHLTIVEGAKRYLYYVNPV